MRFDEILQRYAYTPNVDVDCFATSVDLSGLAASGVNIDSIGSDGFTLYDSAVGFAGGDQPKLFIGFAQNSPKPGETALVRIAGFCRVVYAATVAIGDLLTFATTGGDEGKVTPWVPGTSGHTHGESVVGIVHTIFVCTENGAGVTGIVEADMEIDLTWDNSGTMASAAETVSFAELGSGEYRLSFTPVNVGKLYRLRVGPHAVGAPTTLYVATPWETQEVSATRSGAPTAETLQFILGQAVVAGIAGDTGLMLLRPQVM